MRIKQEGGNDTSKWKGPEGQRSFHGAANCCVIIGHNLNYIIEATAPRGAMAAVSDQPSIFQPDQKAFFFQLK
jgi:hypothetical protein